MATVTTRPPARRTATVPPARSIWHSSQPPKMSPCGLVSAGMAMVRIAGSVSGGTSTAADGVAVGSGIGFIQPCNLGALVRLDGCELDHLGPFGDFVGDEFAELGRGHRRRLDAQGH